MIPAGRPRRLLNRRKPAGACVETTSRLPSELGYRVTLVKDATAAFTREMMRAAHELNGPTFAHGILTTAELIAALPRA
jgi:nicotinamidase-related amidase